MYVLQKYI